MPWYFVVMLALVLSIDTFVASVAIGASQRSSASPATRIRPVTIFTFASILMLLIGWFSAELLLSEFLMSQCWIGSAAMIAIGVQMVRTARSDCATDQASGSDQYRDAGLAFAASRDVAFTGAAFSIDQLCLLPLAISVILSTLAATTVGLSFGSRISDMASQEAQALGGVMLASLGVTALLF